VDKKGYKKGVVFGCSPISTPFDITILTFVVIHNEHYE